MGNAMPHPRNDNATALPTPYYLIDKQALLHNMSIMDRVRQESGAKILLALKCFATWSAFDVMRPHMDGTTSSSLNEVRLGREQFGGETHAYSVAWSDDEIDEAARHADKIIFNSITQLERYRSTTRAMPRGLRLNPGISSSSFDLADPARPFSRLGEWDPARIEPHLDDISGFMIHNNCENADFALFEQMLAGIEQRFGSLLDRVDWVSLGGGIHFTAAGYPLEDFCARLRRFADAHGVQLYLEPGEAAITATTTLEVSVLDTLYNGKQLAIVDASIEAHMLDLLIYREDARIAPNQGEHEVMVCGRSCLAGDIFGTFRFAAPLTPGDRLSILDAAGYTMVKKNWFNGVPMPAIALKETDGSITEVRRFDFNDYKTSLS